VCKLESKDVLCAELSPEGVVLPEGLDSDVKELCNAPKLKNVLLKKFITRIL
jgi:hypothetical protein